MFLYYCTWFVAGACAASFLVTIGFRWATPQYCGKRSSCPHCRQKLSWWQLIPVIGWLLQAGKCRFCQQPIGLFSTLCEILCGTCWCLAAGLTLREIAAVVAVGVSLLVMSATDWYGRWISLPLLIGLLPLRCLWSDPTMPGSIWVTIALTNLLVLAVLFRSLGAGDAELIIVLLLTIGPFYSTLIVMIACCLLLIYTLFCSHQRQLPFIPWLSLAIGCLFVASHSFFN